MDMYGNNIQKENKAMIGKHNSLLSSQSDKNVCVTTNNLSFHPIIVVHNLNGELLPQFRNGIQYIVTSQNEEKHPVTDHNDCKAVNENSTVVECEIESNCNSFNNQKPLIVEQMAILDVDEITTRHDHLLSANQALKTISPTEFLNITDYGSCELSNVQKEIRFTPELSTERNTSVDIDLEGFCSSPLLSESTKEMSLDGENQLQDRILLDVIVPKVSTFSEASEIGDDIFVSSLKEQNENCEQSSDINETITATIQTSQESDKMMKNQYSAFKNNPLGNDNYIPDNDIDNRNCSDIDVSSDPETKEESAKENEQSLITVSNTNTQVTSMSSLKNGYITIMENVNEPGRSESKSNSENTDIMTDFPLTAVDIGVISIMPVESVVLQNITLLPQTSSSIKFQVIQEDGSMKCVSVDPVFRTEDLQSSSVSNDGDNNSGTTEDTTLVAEVITPVENARPFKCELCSATFNRLGNYTRHKKIHTVPTKEDQRFTCDVCGKNFIQRCDLTRHMHIHSGTEPHRCSLCGKGYLRHSDLITHQRFHNKEKPFTCPHCTKGFCQKGDLNRHLRSIHFQIKPLTCGHCQKKFAKEATLIRHMQVSHRDIILCSVSAKEAETGVDLDNDDNESVDIPNQSKSNSS